MRSLLAGCAWVSGLLLLACGGGSSKAPGDGGADGGGGGPLPDGGSPVGMTDAVTMTTRPPAAPLPELPRYTGQIVVTPAAVLLTKMGETASLRAEAFDASGQKMTATFTWESSKAAQVTVSADGQVTAMAATGSAQIRVRAGGLVSAPVLVLVAEPAAGAVLVSDAQVTAGPTAADAMAPATVGAKVKLSLTGITDLPAGTILLAKEGKAVAGKVVSAMAAGGGLEVVLETVPLIALFKRLDIDGTYDIDPAAMAQALAMPPKPTMAIGRRDDVQVIRQPFKLGNKIECESKLLLGALSGNANVDLRPNMRFSHRFVKNDDTGQWTELMLKLDGQLTVSGSVSLDFSPMLAGTASCSATLVKIPIPIGGPLSAVVRLQVPLGIGGEIGATIAVAPLKAGLELTGESKVTMGFHYLNGATMNLSDVSNRFELEPTFTLPGGDSPGATLTASAAFGGTAGLEVGVLLGLGSFSLLEAALLMKAEVKTGPISKSFAMGGAGYDLKPTLEVGPGEDAQKALSWLGGAVALNPSLSMTLPTIARSPRGTLMADKMMARPEEPVRLTVDLQADSLKFLGLDNVVDVRLYRSPRAGATGLELLETQSGSASKASYTFMWTPTFQDGSGVSFWAGVTSRLAPGVALEVNEKSMLNIRLGMKGKRWKGTVTTECSEDKSTPGSTDTFTSTISSTLMLEHVTEEDALNATTKVTGTVKAVEKMTHDYTYSDLTCRVMVHEETIATATELMPIVFQTKFHEDTGMYNLLGAAYVVGTRHMTHTESGSCRNPPVTTSPPDTKFTTNFGYMINGMVAPGSDSFSGTMTAPGEKGMCTWTWDFARAQ